MSIAGLNCWCCGEPWRMDGCVRGPRCDCQYVNICPGCYNCIDHCRCTIDSLRDKVIRLQQALIAATGQVKEEAEK